MGTLIISILLAVLPLIMAGFLLATVERVTVDGLFTSLILVTISGIFGLNAFLDLRQKGLLPGRPGGKRKEEAGTTTPARAAIAAPVPMAAAAEGTHTIRARVENVLYFEAPVGQPNKSLVTLVRDGAGHEQMIFAGDVRNALPKGKRMEIKFRAAGEYNTLLEARDA
ncbi:MAG TPA: hypothetical protein VNK82_04330 [Terriglobales bacterium]|nr:hypothetical protein [Terriglobales bacterium]